MAQREQAADRERVNAVAQREQAADRERINAVMQKEAVGNCGGRQEKSMDLREQLERYIPWNEQEEKDRELMLCLLNSCPDIFTRENRTAHFTASAWLLNQNKDKVLLAYHNIYHSWAWTGGHADGEKDLLSVAKREAMEETGVQNIRELENGIYSLEVLTVDGHEKRGVYVSSHLHLNVTYLLEADETEMLRIKPDENSGVRWFPLEAAVEASSEPWMRERIYQKLNAKLR